MDGVSVVFRRMFLKAEDYAFFLDLFLGLPGMRVRSLSLVCLYGGVLVPFCANAPLLKVERWGIGSRARRSGSALAYFVACVVDGAG
jgi:hypothetical protein